MKLNTKLLTLSLFLILAACSSAEKQEEGSSSLEDSSFGEASMDAGSSDNEAPAKRVEAPKSTTPPSASEAQALTDAIRSNNDEAIARAAQTVLAKNPADAKALNAMGMHHYRKGQMSAASYFFGRAVRANPQSGEIHNNIGLVQLSQGERNEAIQSFKKAMELGNDSNAAANLGAIYLKEKDYSKALIAMEVAYRKNSKDVRVLNNYAVALTAQQKYSDAKDMYKRASSANPNDKDVMLNYAILLINHSGDMSQGLELIDRLKFLGPSAEARNVINALENKAKAGLNKN